MERKLSRHILWLMIGVLGVTGVHCGASNRLREYEFRNRIAAARMAAPPRAQVFTDSFFGAGDDDLLGAVIGIGTSVIKGVEARKTQERLDEAMEYVDIPEHIRRQTLQTCSEYLHFQPTEEAREADFVFMMNIDEYGIAAESWDSSVQFRIKLRVRLVDNKENIEVWKKTIKEEQPVSRGVFGLGGVAADVVTAMTLSELSEEEMIEGFSQLADFVSDRIAERIQRDFIKAHSD